MFGRTLTFSIFSAIAFPALAEASDITGLWARGDGKARVQVEKCGDDFCATNVWVKPGTPRERVGDKLVMDVQPISANRLEGKAKDVRRDLTYNMEITVNGDAMQTKGCLLGQIICKSANWTSLQ